MPAAASPRSSTPTFSLSSNKRRNKTAWRGFQPTASVVAPSQNGRLSQRNPGRWSAPCNARRRTLHSGGGWHSYERIGNTLGTFWALEIVAAVASDGHKGASSYFAAQKSEPHF